MNWWMKHRDKVLILLIIAVVVGGIFNLLIKPKSQVEEYGCEDSVWVINDPGYNCTCIEIENKLGCVCFNEREICSCLDGGCICDSKDI